MSDSEGVLTLQAPNGKSVKIHTGLFINNEFVASSSGKKIEAVDPATEDLICVVEAGSPEDVDKAVQAARAAFKHDSWSQLSGTDRGRLMNRLADLIEERLEDLSTLESWDSGKPYLSALQRELPLVPATIRYYAGWADKLHGLTIPTHPKKFAYTIRQPVGVCAQIIPWNYPLLMAAWKLGPALAAGNTIVLKPAEQTPVSILLVADLIRQAGFPPGVVNIVNGYGQDVGNALACHLGVDKVAFTGSTATGKKIQCAASVNLKKITMETGGKSALILFKDANIQQAVKWAHLSIINNSGQICTGNSRILVDDEIHEEFVREFVKHVESFKVGNPFDEDTFQGPQASKDQFEKIMSYIQIGQQEGAKVVCGGTRHGTKGHYVNPTVFTEVKPGMKIHQEEIFGPVVAVSRFKSESEAIEIANSTEYGLAASLFTQDVERAHRVASQLEAGMVFVNSSSIDSDFRVPFGGVKQSGYGRELGEAGLEGYLETKAVHINLGTNL